MKFASKAWVVTLDLMLSCFVNQSWLKSIWVFCLEYILYLPFLRCAQYIKVMCNEHNMFCFLTIIIQWTLHCITFENVMQYTALQITFRITPFLTQFPVIRYCLLLCFQAGSSIPRTSTRRRRMGISIPTTESKTQRGKTRILAHVLNKLLRKKDLDCCSYLVFLNLDKLHVVNRKISFKLKLISGPLCIRWISWLSN